MDNLIEGLVFFIGISTFMVLIAFICNFFVRRVLLEAIHKLFAKTKTDWDDILIENGVFSRLSYLIPSLVIYFFIIPFYFSVDLINFFCCGCIVIILRNKALITLLNIS